MKMIFCRKPRPARNIKGGGVCQLNCLINLTEVLQEPDSGRVFSLTGGKGYGLWLAARELLPCPQTWVVTPLLLKHFQQGLEDSLNSTELSAAAERFIAGRLAEQLAVLPDCLYAVRSSALIEDSATQSFAGMFESKLSVPRDGLPRAAAEVWVSGLAGRVRGYMSSDRWPEMAVLIQPMAEARCSGVCFSRHPSPRSIRENNHMLVEFASGSGERLVGGEITPLRLSGVPEAMVLSSDYPWLRELLFCAAKLEAVVGGPVDIEFAVDTNERLWLLQQRPVTGTASSLSVDMTGCKKAYKRALCPLDIEFLISGCARYLAPYLEVTGDLAGWMVMLTNQRDFQQELWINEAVDASVVRGVRKLFVSDTGYQDRLKVRYDHHHRNILNWEKTVWADPEVPLEQRLLDFFEYIRPLNAHYYAPMHIIEALSGLVLDRMRAVDPAAGDTDFFTLAASSVTSLSQLFAAECLRLRNMILGTLGRLPETYREIPDCLKEEFVRLSERFGFLNCHQPYENTYEPEEIFLMAVQMDDEAVPKAGNSQITPGMLLKYGISEGWKQYFGYLVHWLNVRNREMEYLYYAYAKAAPLLQQAGDMLGISLQQVWRSGSSHLMASLREQQFLPLPYAQEKLTIIYHEGGILFSDRLRPVFPDAGADSEDLRGSTVYGTGTIEGTVKIAYTPEDVGRSSDSSDNLIIVTGMTTPDFVPVLVNKAAGLVTDEGGILCHAAIIAREISLPCITGTGKATEKLCDGMRIRMDLDRETIKVLTGKP